MHMTDIPFGTTDWSTIEPTAHAGDAGTAYWRTRHLRRHPRKDGRVFTPGYVANHWCSKGHILFCIEGELRTELEDGRLFVLLPGMSYQVADNAEPHRSSTDLGARLFIVD